MKNFIEELYYGNLEPQARAIKPGTEVERQMDFLANSETKLKTILNGEAKDLFRRYVGAWATVHEDAALDSFITGFRMGARFAYDAFESDEALFDELTEE